MCRADPIHCRSTPLMLTNRTPRVCIPLEAAWPVRFECATEMLICVSFQSFQWPFKSDCTECKCAVFEVTCKYFINLSLFVALSQGGRLLLPFPVGFLEIFKWAVPFPPHSVAAASSQPQQKWVPRKLLGSKYGRRAELTTVPSWCAECQIKGQSPESSPPWAFMPRHGNTLPSPCVICFCNKLLDASVKRVLFVWIFCDCQQIKNQIKYEIIERSSC
jgi:hypothetical protein